ncbi:hypothetical protein SUGI_0816060 [Cryptomeria japonica]|nr:hypothetical protein SUGI_0816060 [Cryptomeria japonica]
MADLKQRGSKQADFYKSSEFDFERDIYEDEELNKTIYSSFTHDINSITKPETNTKLSPPIITNNSKPPQTQIQSSALFKKPFVNDMEDQYEPGTDIYGEGNEDYIHTVHIAKNDEKNTENISVHPNRLPSPLSKEEEDRRIKDFINNSFNEWQRKENQDPYLQSGVGNKIVKRRVPVGSPPEWYICNRCGVKGHFIQYCPTLGNPAYDNPHYQRRQRGYSNHYYHNPSPRPDEKAFEKAIQGIPTLMGAEVARKSNTAEGQGGSSNYVRSKPYAGYVCFRCNIQDDHWYRDCPAHGNFSMHRRHINVHCPSNQEREENMASTNQAGSIQANMRAAEQVANTQGTPTIPSLTSFYSVSRNNPQNGVLRDQIALNVDSSGIKRTRNPDSTNNMCHQRSNSNYKPCPLKRRKSDLGDYMDWYKSS